MTGDNSDSSKPSPHLRKMCRREFLKVAAAAAGLLAACKPRQQTAAPLTNTPLTPSSTPARTPTSVPPTSANTASPSVSPTEGSLIGEYIAHCGFDCSGCPYYGSSCDGCLAGNDQQLEGGVIECTVRTCNMERGIANCGHCEEYPCDGLEDMFSQWRGRWAAAAREAKAVLDEIHQSLP
jgi:hypothetical protein